MFDPNDPSINPFARQHAAADPAQVRAGERQRITSAMHGVNPTARGHAKKIVTALENIADTAQTHGQIKAFANSGGHGRQYAQQALDAQRRIVSDSTSAANAALKELRPAVLAAVVSLPDGATPEEMRDKKQDIVTALSAVGKSGANYRAQQILAQAMQANDTAMLYVLMGEPMQYQAEALGYRQDTIQAKYAAAQVERYGLRPLLASESVPGAELINLLPEIAESISGHAAGATQALNALAAECALV